VNALPPNLTFLLPQSWLWPRLSFSTKSIVTPDTLDLYSAFTIHFPADLCIPIRFSNVSSPLSGPHQKFEEVPTLLVCCREIHNSLRNRHEHDPHASPVCRPSLIHRPAHDILNPQKQEPGTVSTCFDRLASRSLQIIKRIIIAVQSRKS
jgi:hypothetical protein